jgi:hypothetical protein
MASGSVFLDYSPIQFHLILIYHVLFAILPYQLKKCASIPGRIKGVFLLAKCPDWLWGPPSLLFSGYLEGYPQLGVKPPTHFYSGKFNK